MTATIDNVSESRTPSARRARFNAEVQRQMRATGLDYDTVFGLVANDPTFAAEFSNDVDAMAADERLKGANQRRDEIQKKVREMMTNLGMSYDNAFAKVLRDNPKLAGYQSIMLDKQRGLIQFNFREGQDLTASKTDYSQQKGFRENAEPAPKVNMQPAPVGNYRDIGVTERPYVKTRVAA